MLGVRLLKKPTACINQASNCLLVINMPSQKYFMIYCPPAALENQSPELELGLAVAKHCRWRWRWRWRLRWRWSWMCRSQKLITNPHGHSIPIRRSCRHRYSRSGRWIFVRFVTSQFVQRIHAVYAGHKSFSPVAPGQGTALRSAQEEPAS